MPINETLLRGTNGDSITLQPLVVQPARSTLQEKAGDTAIRFAMEALEPRQKHALAVGKVYIPVSSVLQKM